MSDAGALVAGRYRLIEPIATGGMGVVWRAWDERLLRVVAVKELLVHPGVGVAADQAAHRAMREARITARLHHPHAIGVYDVVEHEGRPCLIMEYLPSRSLQHLLTERGVLDVDEVADIGRQIAAALGAAHRAGIVHRDVKPANVLLAADSTAKLTDFGISRAFGDVTVTSTGMVTGTPAYLAPEVATGNSADFASDVFSLGSTLYAALEGHPPFGNEGNPIAVLHRVASGDVRPPRRCGRLTPLITDMLRRDPSSRPTMPQVEQALSQPAPSAQPALQLLAAPALRTRQHTLPWMPPANLAPPQRSAPPLTPAPQVPVTTAPARSRRRPLLIGLAVALGLIVSGAIVAVVNSLGDGNAPRRTVQTPLAANPTAASLTAAGPVSGSPRESSPSPTSPTGITSSAAPTGGAALATTPAEAITSYYGLLPGDLSLAWPRLTANYQQNVSGGLAVYQRFWATIAQVAATDVTVQDDGSVEATITYYYRTGRVDDERTRFGLVDDGGQLKIDSSTVLSSHTR